MPKYIAFLRAINVGGHNVKMDHLRSLFESLNLANVETFIASGNVIFDSKSKADLLERKIAKHLQESLGYAVATFVRSKDELVDVARFQPFSKAELEAKGNQLYVAFTANKFTVEVTKKLLGQRSEIDDFCLNGREVYWLYRRLAGESKFYGVPLEKTLGTQTTVRNINTIQRIVTKYS